jgi:hypothetical protein
MFSKFKVTKKRAGAAFTSPKYATSRLTRAAVGLAAVSALALAPMAAQAATTTAQGDLTAGTLTNTAPSIAAFPATLNGLSQTVHPAVGTWNVTDATGGNTGYTVTVGSSAPKDTALMNGTGPQLFAGTSGSMTLTPTAATATTGNPAPTTAAPVAGTGTTTDLTPVLISSGAVTTDNAAAGAGQGSWDFAAGGSLAVVIPGDASAGYYTSTLTYTSAALL